MDRERRLKIAESARDIETATQYLRKPQLPLLVVIDALAEIQGHLRDIAEEAHWEYRDEIANRPLTEAEIEHLNEGTI